MTEMLLWHSHNWPVKSCIGVPLPIFLYPMCSQSSLHILRIIVLFKMLFILIQDPNSCSL